MNRIFMTLVLLALVYTLPARAEYSLSGFELHPLFTKADNTLELNAAPLPSEALPAIALAQNQVLDNLKGLAHFAQYSSRRAHPVQACAQGAGNLSNPIPGRHSPDTAQPAPDTGTQ